MFRHLSFTAAIAACVLCASLAQAQSSVGFSADDYVGTPGATVTIPIVVDSDVDVTGFSFGVTNSDDLTLSEVARTAELDAILGAEGPDADFYVVDTEASHVGFIVAMILPPGDGAVVIPAGTTEIFAATYAIAEDATQATVTITGDLAAEAGAPAVELIVDVNGGEPRAFDGSSATVTMVEGFVRGDADGNGRLTILDVQRVLGYLFQGDQRSNDCLVKLNADASVGSGTRDVEDAADIQISDAILIIDFVFRRSGRPPAEPYPDCGQSPNPVDAGIACSQTNCR